MTESTTPYSDGKPVKVHCGAKTRNGGTCKNHPMLNGRCKFHGGMSPVGVASPQFKHGRYSKYMPAHLGERYAESLADPNLTELRDELALVDTHLTERMGKLYEGESLEKWKIMLTLVTDLDQAFENGDDDEVTRVKGLLRITARQGIRAYKIYEEIQPMIEQRRRLVESEAKRLKDLGQNIPIEKAMGMIARLASIVKRHLIEEKHATPEDTLAAISREFAEIIA